MFIPKQGKTHVGLDCLTNDAQTRLVKRFTKIHELFKLNWDNYDFSLDLHTICFLRGDRHCQHLTNQVKFCCKDEIFPKVKIVPTHLD